MNTNKKESIIPIVVKFPLLTPDAGLPSNLNSKADVAGSRFTSATRGSIFSTISSILSSSDTSIMKEHLNLHLNFFPVASFRLSLSI